MVESPEGERLLRVIPAPVDRALGAAVDGFLVDREAMRCTAKTLGMYRYTLGHFLAFLRGRAIAAPAAISAMEIRAFLVDLGRRGYADTTVHQHARAVKTWCRWLAAEGIVEASPFARVAMPRLDQRILPALTVDQLAAILRACACLRDTAVVLCLLDTGLRVSEFVALNVGDVDLRGGVVVVHLGKGRKDRVSFLGAKSRRALGRYLRSRGDLIDGAALWVSSTTGERLTANGLAEVLTRLGLRAGVVPCRPHLFRRTFALMSLRGGADIHSLARLMGHASIEVLRQYLDVQQADLQEVHRKAGPVDRLL